MITLNSNQYYTGLTNLALVIKMYELVNNDKSERLINLFKTENLSYGDQKVFRALPFPSVSDYEATSSLLGDHMASFIPRGQQNPVNVIEESLKIDQYKVIKSSYTREILDFACTSEDGVNQFISHVMENMEAAKTDFLYDVIIADLFGRTFEVTREISLFKTDDATSAVELNTMEKLNQKYLTLAMQKEIDAMQVYSTTYNDYGLKEAVSLSDLVLIIPQPFKNEGVVNLYAELLNSGVINQNLPRPELHTIPEVKIPQNKKDIAAFLIHKRSYQLFYNLIFMGNFFDPSNLRVNNFLHFWYGKGWLKQLPACILKVKYDKTLGGE